MPQSSQTPEAGRARQELRLMLGAEGHWPGPIEQKLDAFAIEVRADVLREVYAAIEDPAQRAAVGGGLGWETARDVVHNLLRKTPGGAR